jgi:phage baseplate assembly protein V
MLKNMVRIGHVSSLDSSKGTVRVVIDDQQGIVTDDLPLLAHEYNMPAVGDLVLCLFLGNGISSGFCLGKYYCDDVTPPVTNANIWAKDFGDGTSIQYNRSTKELSIAVKGDLRLIVEGNLTVSVAGDIITTAPDGSITTSAGESNTDISHTKTTPTVHHP